jgi:hypothetical protein
MLEEFNPTPSVVRKGYSADFSIRIRLGTTIQASTGFVLLEFDDSAGVSLPTGGELICKFENQLSRSCFVSQTSPLAIKINPPFGVTLTANVFYRVDITSKCASLQGLTYSQAGLFKITISSSSDGNTILSTFTNYFEIFPSNSFTQAILFPLFENSNTQTYLRLKLINSVAIPSGGKIIIGFP